MWRLARLQRVSTKSTGKWQLVPGRRTLARKRTLATGFDTTYVRRRTKLSGKCVVEDDQKYIKGQYLSEI